MQAKNDEHSDSNLEVEESIHSGDGNCDGEEIETSASNKCMDRVIDEIVKPCGLWQWSVAIILALGTPSPVTLTVFSDAVARFRCKMEPKIELFFEEKQLAFDFIASRIGPWTATNSSNSNGCQRYALDWKVTDLDDVFGFNSTPRYPDGILTQYCPLGYVSEINSNFYPQTSAIEFRTLCERGWLAPFGTSIFLGGMLIGFITGGWTADKIGRRSTLYVASIIEIISGLLISLSRDYWAFVTFRVIHSIGNSAKINTGNVLLLELTIPKYRALLGSMLSLGLDFWYRALAALYAFLLPEWRMLNIAIVAPAGLALFIFPLLPESPRWLASRCKLQQTIEVLVKGTYVNHWLLSISSKEPSRPLQLEQAIERELMKTFKADNCSDTMSYRHSNRWSRLVRHLLLPCSTLRMLSTIILSTLVVSEIIFSFYGLLLYAGLVHLSIYLSSSLNALVSLPAIVTYILIYSKCKRRKRPILLILLGAGTVATVSALYALLGSYKTELFLTIGSNLSLFFINILVCMLYIYIPELFVSRMRSSAFGVIFGLSRLAAMFCVYVNELDRLFATHGAAMVGYAGALLLAIACLACLPESTNSINDSTRDGED